MILLSLDCRIIANNEGMTPIDYAIVNKNSEVATVMVMHSKRWVHGASNNELISFSRGEEIMKARIKKYNSLFEGLIANMPDVVKVSWPISSILNWRLINSNLLQRIFWIRELKNRRKTRIHSTTRLVPYLVIVIVTLNRAPLDQI